MSSIEQHTPPEIMKKNEIAEKIDIVATKLKNIKDQPIEDRFIKNKKIKDKKLSLYHLGAIGIVENYIKDDNRLSNEQKTSLYKRKIPKELLSDQKITDDYTQIFSSLRALEEITFAYVEPKTRKNLLGKTATLVNMTKVIFPPKLFEKEDKRGILLAHAGNHAIEFNEQSQETANENMDIITDLFKDIPEIIFQKSFSDKNEEGKDETWKKQQEHVLTISDQSGRLLTFSYPRFPISHGQDNHYLKIINHSNLTLAGLKKNQQIKFYANDFGNDPKGNNPTEETEITKKKGIDYFSKKTADKAQESYFHNNRSFIFKQNNQPRHFKDSTNQIVNEIIISYQTEKKTKTQNKLSALKKQIPLNTLNDKNEMIS